LVFYALVYSLGIPGDGMRSHSAGTSLVRAWGLVTLGQAADGMTALAALPVEELTAFARTHSSTETLFSYLLDPANLTWIMHDRYP
jgi:hypothetical protein